MILVHTLIRRNQDLTLETFFDRWRKHAPLLNEFPEIRQYVQSHRIPSGEDQEPPYDGISQLWFDDEKTANKVLTSTEYKEKVGSDEAEFTNTDSCVQAFATTVIIYEKVVIRPESDLVKIIWGIKRKPGMNLADFRDYYEHKHTKFSSLLPEQLNYLQYHVSDSDYKNNNEPLCDGYTHAWFSSLDDLNAMLTSKELERGVEDCHNFVDMENFVVGFPAREYYFEYNEK